MPKEYSTSLLSLRRRRARGEGLAGQHRADLFSALMHSDLRPSPERRQRRSGGRRLAAIPLDTTVYSSAATRTIIQMPAASAPACSNVSAGVDFAASTAGRMSTAAT